MGLFILVKLGFLEDFSNSSSSDEDSDNDKLLLAKSGTEFDDEICLKYGEVKTPFDFGPAFLLAARSSKCSRFFIKLRVASDDFVKDDLLPFFALVDFGFFSSISSSEIFSFSSSEASLSDASEDEEDDILGFFFFMSCSKSEPESLPKICANLSFSSSVKDFT